MNALKKSLLPLATLPFLSLSLSARAGCTADGSSCLWYAPTYSQHDPALATKWFPTPGGGTMLCGPTASAMALKATIDLNKIKDTTGWTSLQFTNQTKIQRIENFAALQGSDPKTGTDTGVIYSTFKARQAELLSSFLFGLKVPVMSIHEKYGAAIDLDSFRAVFQKPTAMVANYGHYTKRSVKISVLPNFHYHERGYVRTGGHAITPRGVLGGYLFYNDPSSAALEASKIAYAVPKNTSAIVSGVTKQSVETLPDGAARWPYLDELQSANYYPLMEGMVGIRL